MTKDTRLVFPENGGRDPAYQEKLKGIHEAGVCPFCPEHLVEFVGDEYIVRKEKHWVITRTNPPYKGSIAHFLAISQSHITRSTDMSTEAQLEFFALIAWIVEEHDLNHYSVVMRSGNPESGATVAHLHFHIVSAGTENIMARIG